jgi:excisionase family DNA binding protein
MSAQSTNTDPLRILVGGLAQELVRELKPLIGDAVREALAEKAAPPEVLTREQTAALLGINPHHVPRLIERGLPVHRLGKQQRFFRTEVLDWIKNAKEGE